MITSITVDGIKLYDTLTTNTNNLSVVGLQGYNFDKLLNVMLSSNDTFSLPSLTSINIFKRQQPITGSLVDYTVIDKNNILINVPRLIGDCDIQFIPYNVAGYSESSKTLFSPYLSSNSTVISVTTPLIITYIRPVSSFTYRRPDGRSLFLTPESLLSICVDNDNNVFVDSTSAIYLI
jgi:hypothetical protein